MSQRNSATDQKLGSTCGQYPLRTTLAYGAPVACRASIGPGCASSMASDSSLPTKPIDRNAMANMPASAPGPNTATNNSAQISEFTEREETRMKVARRLRVRERVILRAASNATGSARAIESRVPSVAIWNVSINAPWTCFQ